MIGKAGIVPLVKQKLGLSANIERIWDCRAEEFERKHWKERGLGLNLSRPFMDEQKQEKMLFEELRKLNLDGKHFFELGCGYGKFIMLAMKEFPNSSFAGFDFSTKMVELAKKNLPNIDIFCSDLNKMEFEQHDVIFSQDCLDHLTDKQMKRLAPKLVEATKEYLVFVERYAYKYYAHPNNFVFWHNYPEVFKEMELVTFERVERHQEHHLMIFKKKA